MKAHKPAIMSSAIIPIPFGKFSNLFIGLILVISKNLNNKNDNIKDKKTYINFSDLAHAKRAINCPANSSTTTSFGSFTLFNFRPLI